MVGLLTEATPSVIPVRVYQLDERHPQLEGRQLCLALALTSGRIHSCRHTHAGDTLFGGVGLLHTSPSLPPPCLPA